MTWAELEEAKQRTAACMSLCELMQGGRLEAMGAIVQKDALFRVDVRTPPDSLFAKLGASAWKEVSEAETILRHRAEAMTKDRCTERYFDVLTEMVVRQELRYGGPEAAAVARNSALSIATAADDTRKMPLCAARVCPLHGAGCNRSCCMMDFRGDAYQSSSPVATHGDADQSCITIREPGSPAPDRDVRSQEPSFTE